MHSEPLNKQGNRPNRLLYKLDEMGKQLKNVLRFRPLNAIRKEGDPRKHQCAFLQGKSIADVMFELVNYRENTANKSLVMEDSDNRHEHENKLCGPSE